MRHCSRVRRFDSTDALIGVSLFLVGVTACGKSTVTAPAAGTASIAFTAGTAQSGVVGNQLSDPVAVQVTDDGGKPMAGVQVTFAPASGDGSVTATTATTDQYGSAFVFWTLGTAAGTDSLTVTAGSLTPVAALATATPDVPAALVIVAGNDQAAPADSSLATPLELKVTDRFGNAVPNAPVQWTDDANGSLAAAVTAADSSGIVTESYRLGPLAGPEDVIATLLDSSTPTSVSFVEIGE
jgi:hypothetical protein